MLYDIVITGGGIVGLATAYQLKKKNPGLNIVLLEKEDGIARHQTGHNSGVIHSGIYYKPGSLKAQNCIRGYDMLLQFAKDQGIAYDLCGKIIVATGQEQVPAMENVYKRGIENGLQNLKWLSAGELKEYEPHVNGVGGIHVPQTGIIDYKQVAAKYAELFKAAGGEIRLGSQVTGLKALSDRCIAETGSGKYESKLFINCGGLHSDRIARMTNPELDVRIVPFRGEYYMINEEKKNLVRNLIYPVPDPNFPFLGVHFTRMIGGEIEAGPNAVFAFKREGYKKSDFSWRDFSESLGWPGFRKVAAKYWKTGLGEFKRSFSKSAFTHALQELIPAIEEKDLVPAGAGVRAQACSRHGGLIDDFVFEEDKRFIHVLNAPSPAATSSLSIGDTIAEKALGHLQ